MHRGDPREALIVSAQCAGHGGQPGHQSIGADFSAMGAGEQSLDVLLLAGDELSIAPFDQRRSPEEQAVVAAGEAEIVVVGFAETPHVPNRVAGHRAYVGICSLEYVNKKVTLQMALAARHHKSLRQRQKIGGLRWRL
jgi:hypothetical protein